MNEGYFPNCSADCSEEYLHDALKVSHKISQKVRHIIFFVCVSNAFKVEDLYERRDEAPKELTTLPGDLIQFLKMTESQAEYEWGLLHFIKWHDVAREAFTHYMFKNKDINDFDPEIREKAEMIRKLHSLKEMFNNLRGSFENSKDKLPDVEPANESTVNMDFLVDRCVGYVKKSKYHFPSYYKMATGNVLESQGFIDDILNIANTPDPEL